MENGKKLPPSNVVLLAREKMTASGVSEVCGFDEEQIEAKTGQGLLLVRGHGLHIERFDAESGELELTGRIDGLVYTKAAEKKRFWARVLK